MSSCWYCHWGWPKAVAEIYLRAAEAIENLPDDNRSGRSGTDALEFGPTHCLWSDENFGGDLRFELNECDTYNYSESEAFTKEEIAIIRKSVTDLLEIPEKERDPEWRVDSDKMGDHPELAPPPAHIPWMAKAEIDNRSRELE